MCRVPLSMCSGEAVGKPAKDTLWGWLGTLGALGAMRRALEGTTPGFEGVLLHVQSASEHVQSGEAVGKPAKVLGGGALGAPHQALSGGSLSTQGVILSY